MFGYFNAYIHAFEVPFLWIFGTIAERRERNYDSSFFIFEHFQVITKPRSVVVWDSSDSDLKWVVNDSHSLLPHIIIRHLASRLFGASQNNESMLLINPRQHDLQALKTRIPNAVKSSSLFKAQSAILIKLKLKTVLKLNHCLYEPAFSKTFFLILSTLASIENRKAKIT